MMTIVNIQLAKIQNRQVHNHKLVTFLNIDEANPIDPQHLNLKLVKRKLKIKQKIKKKQLKMKFYNQKIIKQQKNKKVQKYLR